MPARTPATAFARFAAFGKRVGDRMAWFLSMAIFSILYFVVFAPTALALRMAGKRFLPEFRGDEPSFFLEREPVEPTMEYARRQW